MLKSDAKVFAKIVFQFRFIWTDFAAHFFYNIPDSLHFDAAPGRKNYAGPAPQRCIFAPKIARG
jgi:hypothetical protein